MFSNTEIIVMLIELGVIALACLVWTLQELAARGPRRP